jgi:hypothetical protein
MLSLASSSLSFAPAAGLKLAPRAAVSMEAGYYAVDAAGKRTGFCNDLPGCIPPMGPWDPLGFLDGKDTLEINRLREAELTHGRVGMLAALGFLVQEAFHPLFSADGGPAIEQIPQLPPVLWFGMTLAITAAESLRISKGWADPSKTNENPEGQFQRLKAGYAPGDLGFDPLGLAPEDPADFREMQERELSHGRLGMIAAAGFLAQEAVSGATWGTYWGNPAL